MALSIDEIMSSLSRLIGGNGGSDGNSPQTFGAGDSGWSPTSTGAPSFGALAGNNLTEGVNANYGGGSPSSGFGMNLGTAQLGLGALGSLGSLYTGMQANKLAKDQFKFTKEITNTNLNNQIKSYNTALGDRINSRTFTQNQDQSVADDYINKNRLTR